MHNISIKDQQDLANLIARVMEVNSLDTIWMEYSTTVKGVWEVGRRLPSSEQ